MPVFGKSVFASMIDGLPEAADDEDERAEPGHRVAGLNSAFVQSLSYGMENDRHSVLFGYEDFSPEPESEAKPMARFGALSPEEIGAELDIASIGNAASLREARRRFALSNHPDRVPPAFRQNATIRMMIANQLIDHALARLAQS